MLLGGTVTCVLLAADSVLAIVWKRRAVGAQILASPSN